MINSFIFVAISTKIVNINDISIYKRDKIIIVHKNTNKMEITTLKSKQVVLPTATLREMKEGMSLRLPTQQVKTATLRMAASNLKREGYKFRVSERNLINETIVECLKSPVL